MITRLQVSGFKNLVDVDVRFGPFTCIADLPVSRLSTLLHRFALMIRNLPLLKVYFIASEIRMTIRCHCQSR